VRGTFWSQYLERLKFRAPHVPTGVKKFEPAANGGRKTGSRLDPVDPGIRLQLTPRRKLFAPRSDHQVSHGMAERPSEDTKRSEVPQRPLTHRTLASGKMGTGRTVGPAYMRSSLPPRMSSCDEKDRDGSLGHLLVELKSKRAILGVIAHVGNMRT